MRLNVSRALERVGARVSEYSTRRAGSILQNERWDSWGHLPRPPERAGWAERRIHSLPKRHLRHYMSAQGEQEAVRVGWLFY